MDIVEEVIEPQDDKCKVMDTDYCKNECPLCRKYKEQQND